MFSILILPIFDRKYKNDKYESKTEIDYMF